MAISQYLVTIQGGIHSEERNEAGKE